MKILVYPKSIEHLNKLKNKNVDFIIGLKDFSIFQELKLDVDDIKKIGNVYVSINRPIHNDMLPKLKEDLVALSKLNIKGIMFEDISVFMINKELGLNLNLIWNTMHTPTNSGAVNFWKERGVNGVVLSTELMIEDFNRIKDNTKVETYIYMYGHVPIFESSRSLITNYFIHKNLSKDSNKYLVYEKERDKYYNIYEEYDNTFITEDIINGINALDNINADYVLMNSLLIDESIFDEMVDKYLNHDKVCNAFTGFLYKESIFKVKE